MSERKKSFESCSKNLLGERIICFYSHLWNSFKLCGETEMLLQARHPRKCPQLSEDNICVLRKGAVLNFQHKRERRNESMIFCKWMWLSNDWQYSEIQPHWMTFTTRCHKQKKLMHLLITGKMYYTSVRERDKEKKIDFINNARTSFKHSWRKITGEVCNVTLIYAIGKKWVVKSSWVINHIYQWQD